MHRKPWAIVAVALAVVACRPSDVLSVPTPAGVISNGALQSQSGAEGAFGAAKAQLFAAADGASGIGLLDGTELLTDEGTLTGLVFWGYDANTDARMTVGGGGFVEDWDPSWGLLLQARLALVVGLPGLIQHEVGSGRSKIGEAYALTGYTELLIAEAFCAGTPIDEVVPGGKVVYGMPLTTDSLLGLAVAHLDSGVAEAHGDATVAGLASIGLGRALLDRGQYAAAGAAVAGVPTSFEYDDELQPTASGAANQLPNVYTYAIENPNYRRVNVADREGGNGLNFLSAHDPRLVVDTSTYLTPDGTAWRVPAKFEVNLSLIPLATGIEARLIEAEAALKAGQTGSWLADLNALRNGGCTGAADSTCAFGAGRVAGQPFGLVSLADPGSDSGRVSLMFRERAFWLYGTGTRLGDLRRLIRQYGRDQSAVFPTGPYANGLNPLLPAPIPNYGTDVSLTLPTSFGLTSNGATITNPHYKGCITSTKTA
jgi:hypothetical protein